MRLSCYWSFRHNIVKVAVDPHGDSQWARENFCGYGKKQYPNNQHNANVFMCLFSADDFRLIGRNVTRAITWDELSCRIRLVIHGLRLIVIIDRLLTNPEASSVRERLAQT